MKKQKENTMKTIIGSILIMFGIIMMAGSANDCDGACMETANTLSEMLVVATTGLAIAFVGFLTLYSKLIK
tara:strand:+ start:779 stop:991 length:213 start_codon:yes stop_codon:yes gene_type:complete